MTECFEANVAHLKKRLHDLVDEEVSRFFDTTISCFKSSPSISLAPPPAPSPTPFPVRGPVRVAVVGQEIPKAVSTALSTFLEGFASLVSLSEAPDVLLVLLHKYSNREAALVIGERDLAYAKSTSKPYGVLRLLRAAQHSSSERQRNTVALMDIKEYYPTVDVQQHPIILVHFNPIQDTTMVSVPPECQEALDRLFNILTF
jgi:hypothetical protein